MTGENEFQENDDSDERSVKIELFTKNIHAKIFRAFSQRERNNIKMGRKKTSKNKHLN